MPHSSASERRLLALLLISAAWSDGHLHRKEAKLIRMGLGKEAFAAALVEYETTDQEGKAALLEEVRGSLQSRQAREKAMQLLKQLFFADGVYSPEETKWIQEVWRGV